MQKFAFVFVYWVCVGQTAQGRRVQRTAQNLQNDDLARKQAKALGMLLLATPEAAFASSSPGWNSPRTVPGSNAVRTAGVARRSGVAVPAAKVQHSISMLVTERTDEDKVSPVGRAFSLLSLAMQRFCVVVPFLVILVELNTEFAEEVVNTLRVPVLSELHANFLVPFLQLAEQNMPAFWNPGTKYLLCILTIIGMERIHKAMVRYFGGVQSRRGNAKSTGLGNMLKSLKEGVVSRLKDGIPRFVRVNLVQAALGYVIIIILQSVKMELASMDLFLLEKLFSLLRVQIVIFMNFFWIYSLFNLCMGQTPRLPLLYSSASMLVGKATPPVRGMRR